MTAVDPSKNLGHATWSLVAPPLGENPDGLAYWRCDSCGCVVGFWRPGQGSEPTADDTNHPENIGVYTGKYCGT